MCISDTETSWSARLSLFIFADLFNEFPSLAKFTNVRTSLDTPNELNAVLSRIEAGLELLPENYQELFARLDVYVARSQLDVQTICNWDHAGACYNRETDTLYLTPDSNNGTTAHELAHAYVDTLSRTEKQALEGAIEPLVSLTEMQQDVVRSSDARSLVLNWASSTESPRYVCPSSYCASNVNEFIAEYVEDIFTNQSTGVITILRNGNREYRTMIVTAVDTLAEHGLLGENGVNIATGIYTQAGLGHEALSVLRN